MEFDAGRLRIFLDVDDVLVDWRGETCKLMGINLEQPAVREIVENTWGMDVVNETRMWEMVDAEGPQYWANLSFLPWGQQLWDRLTARYPVCLLTSPNRSPNSVVGKVQWIANNLHTMDYFIGKPKYWCANKLSVLIDDRPSNCDKFFDAGGHAFLFPNAQKMKREANWQKVLDELLEWLKKCEISAPMYWKPKESWRKLPV